MISPSRRRDKPWRNSLLSFGLALGLCGAAPATPVPPPTVPPCLQLAETAPEQATALAMASLARNPADATARFCHATAAFFSGRFQAAGMEFRQLAAATPAPEAASTLHSKAGWAFARANMLQEAANSFATAAKLTPQNPSVWQDHATILMQTEQFWDAQRELDYALTLSPQNATLLALRAQCWFKLGATAKAKQDATAALALDPHEPLARALLQKITASEH
jgi:Flp pilus assembly protein TadD